MLLLRSVLFHELLEVIFLFSPQGFGQLHSRKLQEERMCLFYKGHQVRVSRDFSLVLQTSGRLGAEGIFFLLGHVAEASQGADLSPMHDWCHNSSCCLVCFICTTLLPDFSFGTATVVMLCFTSSRFVAEQYFLEMSW